MYGATVGAKHPSIYKRRWIPEDGMLSLPWCRKPFENRLSVFPYGIIVTVLGAIEGVNGRQLKPVNGVQFVWALLGTARMTAMSFGGEHN